MASQQEEGQAEDVQTKQEMNEKRQLSLCNGSEGRGLLTCLVCSRLGKGALRFKCQRLRHAFHGAANIKRCNRCSEPGQHPMDNIQHQLVLRPEHYPASNGLIPAALRRTGVRRRPLRHAAQLA